MKTLIVAGIARSGLSLTMQMLDAGGYPCKGEYPAYEPYGVGEIPWDKCEGHAVKLVDAQLQLPPYGDYKVIRLSRNMTEQAKSMNKMLNVMFQVPGGSISGIVESYRRDYFTIDKWVDQHDSMVLDFEDLIEHPMSTALKIEEFTGKSLAVSKMVECLIERTPECYPTMLETHLLGGN